MSVQAQINRVETKISESYNACNDMGATMPDEQVVENLPNTIRSIPIKGGNEAVQEIIYVDFDFDFATATASNPSMTYQELQTALADGKYIVGRGHFSLSGGAKINRAFLPLTGNNLEQKLIVFEGALQASIPQYGQVLLWITVMCAADNDVVTNVRILNTTDIA